MSEFNHGVKVSSFKKNPKSEIRNQNSDIKNVVNRNSKIVNPHGK